VVVFLADKKKVPQSTPLVNKKVRKKQNKFAIDL